MALAATVLTSNYDNVDRVSYPTASISPAANSLLLVFVCLRATTTAGTPSTPTTTLSGLTWTTVNTDLDGIASQGVFTAQCGDTPGTGTITFGQTGGDATHIGASWLVVQITGHNTTTPVAQFKFVGGDGTTSAAPTGVLTNAIGNAGNRVFCYVTHRANQVTNPRTNWTELNDNAGSLPNHASEGQWRNDGTNETTFGATWSGAVRYQMHGVEINIAGGAAVALDGTSTGTSSDTGNLILSLALAGQTDGVSTTTGALALAVALAGQTDGVATVTGAMVLSIALNGQSDGTSTTTGDLTVTAAAIALDGTSDGTSTATADLALSLPLVGQSDGTSTTTGAFTLSLALAASSDGTSTTTGDLSVSTVIDLAGASDGLSTVTGDLALSLSLAGGSDGLSAVTGDMVVAVALVATSDGTSTATGDMLVGALVALDGTSDGSSNAFGDLGFFVQEGLVSVQIRYDLDLGRERTRFIVRSR